MLLANPGMIGLGSPSRARSPASTTLAALRASGPLIAVESARLTPAIGQRPLGLMAGRAGRGIDRRTGGVAAFRLRWRRADLREHLLAAAFALRRRRAEHARHIRHNGAD